MVTDANGRIRPSISTGGHVATALESFVPGTLVCAPGLEPVGDPELPSDDELCALKPSPYGQTFPEGGLKQVRASAVPFSNV